MRTTILAGAATLALVLAGGPADAQQKLAFTSFGGSYQEAQRKALLEPVAKELGIVWAEDTLTGIAEVRAQVRAGAVSWDIVDLGLADCAAAQSEGLLEPLDYSLISTEGFDKMAFDTHWIGIIYYSTVLGYSTERYKDKPPRGWKDFWDVKGFPGARALRDYPTPNLEIALLVDGVPKDQVYQLLSTEEGVARAFAKLDAIKPHITVWWKSGAQSAQLAKDGEVDMLSIWNGRLDTVIKDGAKFAYSYDDGILSLDCLAIIKGSKNKDLAMKALARMVAPDLQANMPLYINYGPTTSKAFETGKITPEMARISPSSPENAAKQFVIDARFWAANRQKMQERWDSWKTR